MSIVLLFHENNHSLEKDERAQSSFIHKKGFIIIISLCDIIVQGNILFFSDKRSLSCIIIRLSLFNNSNSRQGTPSICPHLITSVIIFFSAYFHGSDDCVLFLLNGTVFCMQPEPHEMSFEATSYYHNHGLASCFFRQFASLIQPR